MRVVPISAVLLHFKAIDKSLARFDTSKADTRHAIHLIGQQNPVPVDRGIFSQQVFYADGDDLALAPAQRGARQAAIDQGGLNGFARHIHRGCTQHQIKAIAPQLGRCAHMGLARCPAGFLGGAGSGWQNPSRRARSQTLHKTAPRQSAGKRRSSRMGHGNLRKINTCAYCAQTYPTSSPLPDDQFVI